MRSVLAAFLLASLSVPLSAQSQKKMVEAEDGDLILLKDAARVRVVRRVEGTVRVVYNAQERWVMVLLDQATSAKPADGRVDIAYNARGLDGDWPLGARWEGRATLDDYSFASEPGPGPTGFGLNTGAGLIQLLSSSPVARDARVLFRDPSAVATVTFTGSGWSRTNETFDAAEQRQAMMLSRTASGGVAGGGVVGGFVTGIAGGGTPTPSQPPPPPGAPVRVGGTIRTPARIVDAQPVTPEIAQQAGVRGVVILEIIIGTDGQVTDVKVLRSVPLLDAAAIETARKWRYEPTLLNGAPVPVIMTVTVNFQ